MGNGSAELSQISMEKLLNHRQLIDNVITHSTISSLPTRDGVVL